MQEVGVDISGHESKSVEACGLETLDLVVTVCGDADEHYPVALREHPSANMITLGAGSAIILWITGSSGGRASNERLRQTESKVPSARPSSLWSPATTVARSASASMLSSDQPSIPSRRSKSAKQREIVMLHAPRIGGVRWDREHGENIRYHG